MPKGVKTELLSEDLNPEKRFNREARIAKWIKEFEATNYPNRPLTKQYHELYKAAKEINLI
jgi:hypothetical protein